MSGHQGDFLRKPSHAGGEGSGGWSCDRLGVDSEEGPDAGVWDGDVAPGHARTARRWGVPGWGALA